MENITWKRQKIQQGTEAYWRERRRRNGRYSTEKKGKKESGEGRIKEHWREKIRNRKKRWSTFTRKRERKGGGLCMGREEGV